MKDTHPQHQELSCNPEPDIAAWLAEAKQDPKAPYIGMYLTHNGIVRATPKKIVRSNEFETPLSEEEKTQRVIAVDFSYDKKGLEEALSEARTWEGVYYVRAWLNSGRVPVGSSLMYVLIGADIRPHAIEALNKLVGHIKNNLVTEIEVYA
jgi:molybdopterin synthase catalytic subunit